MGISGNKSAAKPTAIQPQRQVALLQSQYGGARPRPATATVQKPVTMDLQAPRATATITPQPAGAPQAAPASPVQAPMPSPMPSPVQAPVQAPQQFGAPHATPSVDIFGRTAAQNRASAIDDYRAQLDINRLRAAQGLTPINYGHNDSSRGEMEAMLRSAGYDTSTGARMGEQARDYSQEYRDLEARNRAVFANDPRTHGGQRLSDIFSGGGFHGLPGTGSY